MAVYHLVSNIQDGGQ